MTENQNEINLEFTMLETETAGSVTAPIGYTAAGLNAGIKKNNAKNDLAIIYSEVPANVGGVFTKNLCCAAPVNWDKKVVATGTAQAMVVNSGNANACTGKTGDVDCQTMAKKVGDALNLEAMDVCVCSTGVIGVELPMAVIEAGIEKCATQLSKEGSHDVAKAMVTTDTYTKEVALSYEFAGKTITVGGVAKGSGMIHPNMATMLCFVTTDAAISAEALNKATKYVADRTFNMVTVDGDTSTNDSMLVMANGLAENPGITFENDGYIEFVEALFEIASTLSMMMAHDGEGATKLLECTVSSAKTWEDAKTVAKSVLGSSLVKSAFYGEDANWGRIIAAVGYAGVDLEIEKINLWFINEKGTIQLMENGAGLKFDEELAKTILQEKNIEILIDLNAGDAVATGWGCDLTHEYVSINADYRS